jgi:two-component system sensor histidine kinase and response regulator WspE
MSNGNGFDLGDMSMMDLFRMEAENQCNQISEDLVALEQDPTAADLLESLMRSSHSVKGAARVVELHPAVQVAHAMEDVFVAAQDCKITLDQDGIDMLLKGVDMLSSISQVSDEETDSFCQEKEGEIDSLVNAYASIAKGEKSEIASSADVSPAESTLPEKEESIPVAETDLPADLSDMTMMDLFRMEAENHCMNLSDALLALEKDPQSQKHLESMMRAAHSMKGAAKIVDLNTAVKLAHAMEDVFVAAQKGKISIDKDDIDLLLKGVDQLDGIAKIPESETDKWFSEHTTEINTLIQTYKNLSLNKKTPKKSEKKADPKAALPQEPKKEKQAKEETVEPPEVPPTKKPARRKEDRDGQRAVRVSAHNMERMMGLSGEVLIESRWLPTFNKDLLQLKYRQDELYASIDYIRENLNKLHSEEFAGTLINDLQYKLEICRKMLQQEMEVLEEHARHATTISHRLYTEVITSKMRPFSEGIRGFSRMVRDVAKELGKEVNFEVIGEDTMVDRDILEKIEAPLNHMIRNALDHGLETPDERNASGKTAKGTIQLEARHSAGMLSITVRDDGRGVDLEKLRQTIVERKMCTKDMADDLSDHELLEFLFLPNFSTKKTVSKVSGRGVGMDVVHNVINEVRGMIRSSTKIGKGSNFELQLPLTLSVLRALLTEINDEPYAFPLVSIDHVVQLRQDQIQEVEGRQYFTFNEKRIGIVSAQQIFNTPLKTPESDDEDLFIIVFSERLNQYGLIVDRLQGVRDLVVQKLDPRLGKVKDISSGAILEDGTPILIIDVEDVFRSMDQLISENRLMRYGQFDETRLERRIKRILVADDSITVREVERKMLLARGYDVDVAVDGMEAWNIVRANEYDLVVSDIDMPRMNGFELVENIKNDPNLRHLPVIIVSYKDREEDRTRGLEVGADYYLTKGSFKDETLVNAVLDLIGEPGDQ